MIIFVFSVHFSTLVSKKLLVTIKLPNVSSREQLTIFDPHSTLGPFTLMHESWDELTIFFENGEILTCQAWATENQVDLAVSANWSILSSCVVNGQRRKILENRMVTDIVHQQTGNVLYRHFMCLTQQLQLFPHSPSLDKWRGTGRATFSFL